MVETWGCCCGWGATISKASNGFSDWATGAVRAVSKDNPFKSAGGFAGGVGVFPRDLDGVCSPNLISASTVLSRFPFSPFNTVELRFSSAKPISFNVANFESSPSPVTLEPKTLDGLLIRGGDASWSNPPRPGDTGGVAPRGRVEDFCMPNPNLLPGFGGRGGGLSSTELVLPVLCRVPG